MARLRRGPVALAAAAVGALVLAAVPAAFAAFGAKTENGGNLVTAAADFRAPQVTAVAIGKTVGGTPGFVKQGGEYFVYANVAADTGNPASGLATVRASVANITTGSTAIEMVAGAFSAGGVAYGFRSATLTATTPQAEGAKSFSVTATDNAGNAGSLGGSVTVDNTVPQASDVQTTNVGGGTVGLAEQGDTLVLTFSEPIEPQSVLAGWTGAATNVVLRINDNGLLGLPAGNDSVQIWNSANSALLPLGAVDLGRSDYVAGLLGGNVRFGASGTPSTMTMSGNTITLVLGTYNSTIIVDPGRGTAAGTGTAIWTPVATPYDRAASAMSTTPASESGAADKEF
ncbi:MAG TPA: hypothetical protein VFX85_12905 [Solirubrobacterales bacterium]|nr:hypothetical protein [Solirubrobacterales bacterium]